MKNIAINGRKRVVRLLWFFVCALPIWVLAACGGGGGESSSTTQETGSAILSVDWHLRQVARPTADTIGAMAMDCETIGVDLVKAVVYAADGTHLTEGIWDCSDHGGTIDGIPVGDNRIVVLLGMDSEYNIFYRGEKGGITILARQNTDVGTIDAYSFIPEELSTSAASTSQIDISWGVADPTASPAGYRIYRDGSEIDTVEPEVTTFSDTDLSAGTQYCYTVVAFDDTGLESPATTQSCATTPNTGDTQAPTAPGAIVFDAVLARRINLSWDAATDDVGVSGYRIARDGAEIGKSAIPYFSDSGLTPETEYCYTVTALDAAGNRSAATDAACATTMASADTTPPSIPSGLVATATSTNQIDLTWTAATDNESVSGYLIYRDDVEIGTSASTVFNDTGLNPNTRYCYTVAAYDAAGNASSASEETCATTMSPSDTQPPAAPAGVAASATSAGRIDLSWSPASDNVGVTGYVVYRDGAEAGTSESTSFSDTGLSPDTRYCYTVAAYDAADNVSANSAEQCATTLAVLDWYHDADGDGYGDPSVTQQAISQPQGYVSDSSDCDDTAPGVHPGAAEVCDGIDNNCDGSIDENLLTTFYRDADGDGFGDPLDHQDACSAPSGYVLDHMDCNDAAAGINPAATEVCDQVDNNCDGNIDEDLLTTFYLDDDGDGYGDASQSTQACQQPNGYVTDNTDCRDDLYAVNPGITTDACHDGLDNDCNGTIDDNCPTCYPKLNAPELELTNKQVYYFGSFSSTVYTLTVANLSDFPSDLFVLSKAYPCGESIGSRTVVEIYDSNHKLLENYCDFSAPSDLKSFSFTAYSYNTYPQAVYIVLYDQECSTTYTSNLAIVDKPVQVSPQGFISSINPGKTTFVWEAVPGAVSYTIEVQVQGATVATATNIQGTSHTLSYSDDYGEWRVWAVDALGNSGPVSGLISFYYGG